MRGNSKIKKTFKKTRFNKYPQGNQPNSPISVPVSKLTHKNVDFLIRELKEQNAPVRKLNKQLSNVIIEYHCASYAVPGNSRYQFARILIKRVIQYLNDFIPIKSLELSKDEMNKVAKMLLKNFLQEDHDEIIDLFYEKMLLDCLIIKSENNGKKNRFWPYLYKNHFDEFDNFYLKWEKEANFSQQERKEVSKIVMSRRNELRNTHQNTPKKILLAIILGQLASFYDDPLGFEKNYRGALLKAKFQLLVAFPIAIYAIVLLFKTGKYGSAIMLSLATTSLLLAYFQDNIPNAVDNCRKSNLNTSLISNSCSNYIHQQLSSGVESLSTLISVSSPEFEEKKNSPIRKKKIKKTELEQDSKYSDKSSPNETTESASAYENQTGDKSEEVFAKKPKVKTRKSTSHKGLSNNTQSNFSKNEILEWKYNGGMNYKSNKLFLGRNPEVKEMIVKLFSLKASLKAYANIFFVYINFDEGRALCGGALWKSFIPILGVGHLVTNENQNGYVRIADEKYPYGFYLKVKTYHQGSKDYRLFFKVMEDIKRSDDDRNAYLFACPELKSH